MFEASTRTPTDVSEGSPERSSIPDKLRSVRDAYLIVGGGLGMFVFFSHFWPLLRGIWFGCPLVELGYYGFIAMGFGFVNALIRAFLWIPSLAMWFMEPSGGTFWNWLLPGLQTTGVCGH